MIIFLSILLALIVLVLVAGTFAPDVVSAAFARALMWVAITILLAIVALLIVPEVLS